ncbi:MAG: RagB/SusD family nutrient uptake outer membrane protein [Prevotellaceae bacterium]|nr:RagB/SusD family nutrient uptake outer membrane protein [Prevotellaceae bacterium]
MKNIIKKTVNGAGLLTVACLSLLCISCDLDRYPFNAIEQTQAFQTLKDATMLNNTMYSQMRGRIYGIYSTCADIQGDLYHATIGYGNRRGSVYTWTFVDDDYDIRDIWSGYYGALANVNNFLDNIDRIAVKDDTEKASLANLKGEAYFFRAYYYEKLVKRYAKDYEPATAASELGVPLVLHFNLAERPGRATIEQVYAQILSDLKEAKALMTTVGKPGSNRLTKDCITALEARVYLDMHRYGDAVTAASALINSNTYPLTTSENALKDVWAKDAVDESILMLFASSPNELGNANNIFLGYDSKLKKYIPDFVPEQWVIDLYDDADFRKTVYFANLLTEFETKDYQMFLLNKYPGNPALYSGNVSNYQHKPKVFRIAETHLIKAEALAWDGRDVEALAALNTLRTARGLTALANVSGDALKNEIKAERIRELIGEGNRIDDLKRWKEGLSRKAAQSSDIVTTVSNAPSLSKPADDFKFVWAIPSRDMTTNPSLSGQQNPGWGSK